MIRLRKATSNDLEHIKVIADSNKPTLGFVTRPALLFGIHHRWLFVAESDGVIVGFVHYRHRRDTQTTIYELCVSQQRRGQGIGRLLVEVLAQEAQSHHKAHITLKAIAGIDANGFYEHLGFVLVDTEQGKKRKLNIWKLNLTSSIVQAVIPF